MIKHGKTRFKSHSNLKDLKDYSQSWTGSISLNKHINSLNSLISPQNKQTIAYRMDSTNQRSVHHPWRTKVVKHPQFLTLNIVSQKKPNIINKSNSRPKGGNAEMIAQENKELKKLVYKWNLENKQLKENNKLLTIQYNSTIYNNSNTSLNVDSFNGLNRSFLPLKSKTFNTKWMKKLGHSLSRGENSENGDNITNYNSEPCLINATAEIPHLKDNGSSEKNSYKEHINQLKTRMSKLLSTYELYLYGNEI